MGIWGTSLYDQDITCDVRDHYLQLLKNGCSNEEAFLVTVQEFAECMDSDEEPLFWFALADTQWSYGRLLPEVRQRALDWMEREDASYIYCFEPNDLRRWLREISRLKTKLYRKQPKEKVIEDPADYQYNPGKTGDVFAYQLHRAVAKKHSCHGKYILMQKIGECFNGMDYLCPVFVFLNCIYDDLPSDFNPEESSLLPFDVPERFMPSGRTSDFPKLTMGAILDLYLKKNSPERYMVPLGTYPLVYTGNQNNGEYGWDEFEDTFLSFYADWKDYLYVMKEDCAIVLPKDTLGR